LIRTENADKANNGTCRQRNIKLQGREITDVKKRRWTTLILIAAVLFFGSIAVGFRWWVHSAFADRIYPEVSLVPESSSSTVAIVFGAGVWRGNRPSPILYDRIATSVDLYRSGKVKKLLMSGDNRVLDYNEPAVMRDTALSMGIPDRDIVLDYAGRRTFDTCYRAKEIFGVENAVLVTQRFHLDRAMYLCSSVGINSVGVVADRQSYSTESNLWSSAREIGANLGAWFDLKILPNSSVMGDKLPIDFNEKR
jgi:SanA protein